MRLTSTASILTILLSTAISPAWAVKFEQQQDKYLIDNGKLKITLAASGNITHLEMGSNNLLAHLPGSQRDPDKIRSGYLDYHSGRVTPFIANKFTLIENTPQRLHIMFQGENPEKLALEYHYIIPQGSNGFYSYVVAENKTPKPVLVSELRVVYRFDPLRLNHLFNGQRDGIPLLYSALEKLPKIQDETWRLPSGDVYSKYDFAGYQRQMPFWGVYGDGLGAWLIPASPEYFSGDSNKQELLVHQDAIVLNYLTGAHLGSPDMIAPPGWQKLYGPWFMYFNQGDVETLKQDVQRQALAEQRAWPYTWVKDDRYSTQRAEVLGRVLSPTKVNVTLSSSLTEPTDVQTLGYAWSSTSDAQGRIAFNNVVKGQYRLDVYASEGQRPGLLYSTTVNIQDDATVLADITLPPFVAPLWSIGQSDRSASEFRFGNAPRGWQWQHRVPASLTFDIGRSDPHQDWYYAQTQPGDWSIRFSDTADRQPRYLNVAFAAVSNFGMDHPTKPVMQVLLNNKVIKTLAYENDKAIYRGATRSGKYHNEKIELPADKMVNGNNTVTFRLQGGAFMYDFISWSKK